MGSEPGQAAQAQRVSVVAPPREAVLPAWGYALLGLEALGLFSLHYWQPEESGGERYSYALGWAGLASMIVMHVYSLRRRVRALAGLGRLRSWLRFHIFLGLQGALLVTYHSLHLRDVRTIQGANIACVYVVVASGIFGRYLFSLIPKSLSGERLSARQVETELAELAASVQTSSSPELAEAVARCAGAPPSARSFGQLVAADARARKSLRELDRALGAVPNPTAEVRAFARMARRRVMLTRRLATLSSAERLFRYWTIFHKPLTFLLAAATLLHVLAHYIYGAGMSG